MLSLTENVLVALFTMGASLLFMVGLNRVWPVANRHPKDDLVGWQLSVLGTTYAVTLGFMLYTGWTNFSAASLNAEMEANALRNIYRLAEGLPEQRAQIQALARAYADAVVDHDWPDMSKGRLPEDSHEINENMWKAFMAIKAASPSEITAEDHALSELSALTQYRRARGNAGDVEHRGRRSALSRVGPHQRLRLQARADDHARNQLTLDFDSTARSLRPNVVESGFSKG